MANKLRVQVSYSLLAPCFFDRVINPTGLTLDDVNDSITEAVQGFNDALNKAMERRRREPCELAEGGRDGPRAA